MGASSSILSQSGGKIPIEKRIRYLKNTPFSLYLSEGALEEFARCFPNVIKVNEGKSLSLELNHIYVMAMGELELYTILPSNENKIEAKEYLHKRRKGDIVNKEQSKQDLLKQMPSKKLIMLTDDIHTTARSKTLLLCSDQKSLESFRSKNPDLSQYVDTITKTQIEDYLSPLPFLKDVTQSKLRVLAAMCRYEAFDADETVFEENEFGTKLYILLHGQVAVYTRNENDSSKTDRENTKRASLLQRLLEGNVEERNIDGGNELVKLANLKKGDYFGETALIVNIPRTTTIKTETRSLFLTVDKMDFKNFLKVCPIKEQIMRVMKERMLSNISLLGISFLTGIPSEKLCSLSSSAEIHEMQEGDVVFSEGDPGDRFYLIVYGNVKFEIQNKDSEKQDMNDDGTKATPSITIGQLGPGNYFGEMALVNDSPRSATITSLGKSVLLSVGKENFHHILDSNEQSLTEFNLRLMGNRSELRHILAHPSGINVFHSYLERTFAEENLDFWVKVKSFQENNFQNDEELLETAKVIYVEFCDVNSERQVNIPGNMRTKLEQELKSGKVDKSIFNEAKKEIYNLMNRNNYTHFKCTSEFKDYFKSLGVLI